MIVIADTSPVNHLLLIGAIDLLPELYGRVLIPQAVLNELGAASAPAVVKSWLLASPEWLEVRSLGGSIQPELGELLDKGEAEAIQLAIELNADLLIIDEKLGRRIAASRGLRITGTVGVLALAGEKGMIDIREAIESLENTNFFISKALKDFLQQFKKN